MNVTQQGVLTLLKSAMTGQALALPDGFDLEAAATVIRRHHILPLIYDGAVRCGISPEHPLMRQMFVRYCGILRQSEQQLHALERIYRAFEENGIDYMPLKGANMKFLYPKPELRVMGDADILIRPEQYGRIIPIMESLGFAADGESDHEYIWKSPELYLELHKRLIPTYNRDFYTCLGDGWDYADCTAGTRYSMTEEDTFVYLFTHFSKHYRDGGIGCRHVLDLWVYLNAHPDMDRKDIRKKLESLQLWEFYENIRRLMGVWFCGEPENEKTSYISDFLFSSGSWGALDVKVLSEALRNSRQKGSRSRLTYLWNRVFPKVWVLKREYPILNSAGVLLPVFWLIRPFHRLLAQPDLLKQQRKNLDTISARNLEARQKMLQYVGLDYHF